MQSIQNDLGHKGHSVWWILVELCAEKLEKPKNGGFDAASFKFVFNQRFLRRELRISGAKVTQYLHKFATLSLLSCTLVKDEWHLEMPKLLESLDRDTRRARHERATSAPKIKIKNKDKDIKADSYSKDAIETNLDALYQRYPRKEGKSRGMVILRREAKTADDFILLNDALSKFIAHHEASGTAKEFIPQFKTWASSWRDCLDPAYGQATSFDRGQKRKIVYD